MEPPARNVLWRAGYPELPKHEDDDYLLCAEEGTNYCPPCGDTPDSPKPMPHQAGGKWALGIIPRNYSIGETVSVSVSVTNSHGGYMEFKLCPNNDVTKPVTQRCLDQHPVEVVGHSDGRVPVTAPYQSKQEIHVQIRLPRDLHCSQCVLQMSQYAEQFKPSNIMFRNCADIGILSSSRSESRPSYAQNKSSSRRNRQRKSSSKNNSPSVASFGSSNIGNGYQESPREISFPDQHNSGRYDNQEQKRGHNYNQRPKQPLSASVFGQQPRNSQSRPSSRESSHRFSNQNGDRYTQSFHHDFLYGKSLTPLIRNERQPSLPDKYSSKSQKQSEVLIFPGQSSVKSPEYQIPASVRTKFSGANKAKFMRVNSNKSGNKGFSGYVSSGSDSSFQSRSKSMFPLYDHQLFSGFAAPQYYF